MKKFYQSLFLKWGLFALCVRWIASATHSGWHHPDEWFQTAEFANLLYSGSASYVQEIALHMRNLTWPAILTAPLALANALNPSDIGLKVFLIQLLAGLFSLGVLWGAYQFTLRERMSRNWQIATLALFTLPWFLVADSIRPGSEYLSASMLWLSLGLLVRRQYLCGGLLAMAIGALRYPSGTASLGILLCLAVIAFRSKNYQPLLRFGCGLLIGAVLFGLADWIFYGHPWESLWMYLQYNVFTDLSHRLFGSQSIQAYWDYLWGHWVRMGPVSVLILPLSLYGTYLGFRRLEPWAWAVTFYLFAHLLTPHKEPRFMAPIEMVLIWSALYSLWAHRSLFKKRLYQTVLRWAVVISLLVNLPFFLKGLWGQSFKVEENYFEISKHLEDHPNTCAVITPKRLSSVLVPRAPSTGFEVRQRVRWIENAPKCDAGSTVLFQVRKPSKTLEAEGCHLLRTGILRLTPRSVHAAILDRGWLSGPWYRCPPDVIQSAIHSEQVNKVFVEGFGKLDSIPPLGITGDELLRIKEGAFTERFEPLF